MEGTRLIELCNSSYYCTKEIAKLMRVGDTIVAIGHQYDHTAPWQSISFHISDKIRLTEYTVDVTVHATGDRY